MSNEIQWCIHVRAKREAKARKVLQHVIAAIGLAAEERSVEHWKIPEQYVLEFATPIEAATQPEASFRRFSPPSGIGAGWGVSLQDFADGSWQLGIGEGKEQF